MVKKTTVAEFEAQVTEEIARQVKSVRSPFPTKQIATVNHVDNFCHYYRGLAYGIIIDEFMLLDDMGQTSNELVKWFNDLDHDRKRIPLITNLLEGIWKEYQKKS